MKASLHGLSGQMLRNACGLACPSELFAPWWIEFAGPRAWRQLWAVTPHERLRLRAMLDAVIAALYGLREADYAWVLAGCDHPVAAVNDKRFSRALEPKGFWRVDKDVDPELRLPVLAQVAFRDLGGCIQRENDDVRRGILAFLGANDGDGWLLPETLRLADYGLGHDDRAKVPQPVASQLGPRFLPWQLEQSVEESWTECARHARAILGDAEFERLTTETASVASTSTRRDPTREPAPRAVGSTQQGSLFSAEAFQLTAGPPTRLKKAKK
jgi:hypothetical protein